MKKILSFIVAVMLSATGMAEINRPKLVVGLVVDQMRWDYLYYYYDQFQADGLRRLIDGGYSFENTMINYVPTVTAVGHSSIYTGSVPALHGIVGNNFYMDGKKVYCCDDATVQSVGSNSKAGQMSPRNLLATGLGDMLKIHTDYKAKVVGVALKDRAAILPAGHAADAAYWWDTSAGKFISSTYYMKQLPDWVEKVNKEIGTKPGIDVKVLPEGVVKTFRMAEAALINEGMGQDDITDLLAVSVSSTDAIAHQYGTRHKLTRESYMELDRQLAAFFKLLDERVGRGNYLMFLSADHGGAHNPNELKAHNIPSGGLETWTWLGDVDKRVAQKLGVTGKIIKDENAGGLYLDHEVIERSGKTLDEVKQALIAEIEKRDEILYVVDYDKALTTSIPQPIRERIVNGYNKKRCGDLFYVAKAGWENVSNKPDYIGTTHGQWNPYDAHIPFVLYGWNVNHGETSEPTNMTDIAPTICAMLHIQMPNSCVGNAKTVK
ncbi:type I phosphodiesterase / nucleotide pyrophosphatase [Bacteroidales bacterium KA00344]|nr:type I phosphodiesterase / nucleotide pyrophosphatase [Bacteroidales bacterium KA00344]